eukprot:gnl/TRDRNA2_/TRDRNA2_149439_c0_seq1.p1 gnl/TRDRNA2_/TRDRNA2_149439_c0~~gnl/TRDRNA2_/TRDRNA2_149439_c0_seq1.p1  ORF type:complete len:304 (-),score=74.31 gnl/TRDRNA2_/TRDRNA2_149439_c0_seq1:129-1040(-)
MSTRSGSPDDGSPASSFDCSRTPPMILHPPPGLAYHKADAIFHEEKEEVNDSMFVRTLRKAMEDAMPDVLQLSTKPKQTIEVPTMRQPQQNFQVSLSSDTEILESMQMMKSVMCRCVNPGSILKFSTVNPRGMMDMELKPDKPGGNGSSCWWQQHGGRLLCPLTQFPISLLPYPPFKLRVDPKKPNPHKLVDGKYLAVLLIATGSFTIGNRDLRPSQVKALDEYMNRCKLGPFRPNRALSLARELMSPEIPQERREQAALELDRFCQSAKVELEKLQLIKENRLAQLKSQSSPQLESKCTGGK